jgi:hypothetical protein
MGVRRAQYSSIEHSGQRDIDREASCASHFRFGIVSRRGLADHGEFAIRRQGRRLVGRNLAHDLLVAPET